LNATQAREFCEKLRNRRLRFIDDEKEAIFEQLITILELNRGLKVSFRDGEETRHSIRSDRSAARR
jgi:hypothetical protein